MKDKLQKIREEVARIQAYTQSDVLKEVLDYIDKVQEEPVSEEWIEELRTKLDSMSKEDFKKVFDKYAVDFNEESVSVWHDASETPEVDRTFLLVAPNGNSSLCLWGGKELHSVTLGGGHLVICQCDKWAYIDELLKL